MKILQGVEHAELRAQVEMKRGVADGSKVDENHIAVRLLQRYRGIDCGGGASRASLGTEVGKYAGLARASESAGAGRTEAGESFEQRFGASRMIEIFSGAGAHAGNNTGGMCHLAVGEDGNLLSGGANQFDGTNGALGVTRGNVDDDDFGTRILKLAEDGVGGAGGKAVVAEHRLSQATRFQTILQRGKVVLVLGEEGDGDAMHSAVLADFSRCLHVRKRSCSPPSDLGNGTKTCRHPIRAKAQATQTHDESPGGRHNVDES